MEAAAAPPLILAASFKARWQFRTGQLQGGNDGSVRGGAAHTWKQTSQLVVKRLIGLVNQRYSAVNSVLLLL